MSQRKTSKQVLGVMVTTRTVQAALLDIGSDEPRVLRRFMRQRGARTNTPVSTPDFNEPEEENDYTVQFTTGSWSENMFLGSEFSGFEAAQEGQLAPKESQPTTFALELGDILSECREAGYDEPPLAFCTSAAEINQIELRFQRETKLKKDGGGKVAPPKPASREELLDLLKKQHSGEFSEECVAFLQMTSSDDGALRYMAIFPKPSDAVSTTLRTMRDQQGRRMPPIRLLDTELPIYLGLGRAVKNFDVSATPPAPDEVANTLIVRAGVEDTLVLFMHGDTLHQSEHLRSLTAYEAPETICSRVLLLQDEYGIGEVQHVLLLSEEREDDLVESFSMFFPDAHVESLRHYVPIFESETTSDMSSGALLPAVGVGLRLSHAPRYRNVFEDINLLPRQLLRRRVTIPVTWHVLALYVLIFCTVLFFMARYFTLENNITTRQRNIQQFEQKIGPLDMDARVLQAKIDSLEAIHSRYMRAINVLEGLLMGSDKWSRALEKTSAEVAKVSGIWIENWTPRGNEVELSGNAMSRDKIVDLATRLNGTISTLTFSEIRTWPVYSFKLVIPMEITLPKAAEYLRENVAAEGPLPGSVPVTSTALPPQQ